MFSYHAGVQLLLISGNSVRGQLDPLVFYASGKTLEPSTTPLKVDINAKSKLLRIRGLHAGIVCCYSPTDAPDVDQFWCSSPRSHSVPQHLENGVRSSSRVDVRLIDLHHEGDQQDDIGKERS